MTKEEFIKGYCERSGVTWEWLQTQRIAVPCACGEEYCDGWAMIRNEPYYIKMHNELYGPADSISFPSDVRLF